MSALISRLFLLSDRTERMSFPASPSGSSSQEQSLVDGPGRLNPKGAEEFARILAALFAGKPAVTK